MGSKQQKMGADWEQVVLDELDLERRRQRALIERRKPGMKILRPLGRGKFECVHDRHSTVDFAGALASGRAVCFDAKHSSHADRFAFGCVADEQLEHMAARARFGAVTFLYVLHAPSGAARRTRWLLPVSETARIASVAHKRSHELLVNETRESVRWDALPDELRVLPGETVVDAVLRLLDESQWWARRAA